MRLLRALLLLLVFGSLGFGALASTAYRVDYSGSGITGPYAVPWAFFGASDLRVIKADASGTETALTYLSDYTVTGGTNTTGSVTLNVALPIGSRLMIDRGNMPQVQPVSLLNNGPFNAKTHEFEFDRLTMLDQQQQAAIDHSIRAPPSEVVGALDLILPPAATRANLYLGFDSNGHVTVLGGGGGGGGGGSGSVTSVAMSVPGEFSVSGSPVTTAGTFTIGKVAQSANLVWAGPATGAATAPSFRALVTADLPLTAVSPGTYNTANITVDATGRITAASVGSGGVTSVNTRTGGVLLTGTDIPAFVASGGSHAAGAVPDPGAGAGTTKFLREDATWAVPPGGGGGGSGTVTSVDMSVPAEFAIAGNPVTTSGTLAVTKATQAKHTAWQGPTSGSAAAPTFRQADYNDVATTSKLYVNVTSDGSNINIASCPATIDGVSVFAGERVLLRNQTTASQNGIWQVVASGSALVRPEDFASGNTLQCFDGLMVYVMNAFDAGKTFTVQGVASYTIDTTGQTWAVAKTSLNSGAVSGTLAALSGGTGLDGSTAANGKLLIGNGSGYTLANVTAGTGMAVTNGAGSISLASVGSQTFSNADYTVTASGHAIINVAQTGTLTAARTVTLPAASGLSRGQVIRVLDESRSVTGTNTLIITRAGSDTVAGGTSITMSRSDMPIVLESDGTSKWNLATNDGLPAFATGWLKNNGTSNSWSTITTGDVSGLGGMATQNATAVAITGGAIDGTSLGSTTRITGTAKVTALDVSQGTITVNTLPAAAVQATWNSGAVVFTGLLVNVTNSASSASSLLQDWQVGGASFANLTRGGSLTLAGNLAMSAGTLTVGGVNQAVTSTVVSGSNTAFLNGQVTANPGSSSTGVLSGIKGTAITNAANAQNITTTTAGQGGGGLNGVTGLATHAGTGTVSEANGFLAQVSTTNTSGTITADAGVRVLNPSKAGGTTITTNYGVKVEDQTAGTTNYAVYTGTGQVYHGDDVIIGVVGKGLQVKEGTNAKMGTATLVGGVATVSTTAVTASSRIQLTGNADGGTPGWLRVDTRTAGTSFHIQSSSGTDTSTVAWFIVEPAP